MIRPEKKLSAREVLLLLIDEGLYTLDDLNEIEERGSLSEFQFGIRTSTVAFMEILQMWEESDENGLDFDIEEAFPV